MDRTKDQLLKIAMAVKPTKLPACMGGLKTYVESDGTYCLLTAIAVAQGRGPVDRGVFYDRVVAESLGIKLAVVYGMSDGYEGEVGATDSLYVNMDDADYKLGYEVGAAARVSIFGGEP